MTPQPKPTAGEVKSALQIAQEVFADIPTPRKIERAILAFSLQQSEELVRLLEKVKPKLSGHSNTLQLEVEEVLTRHRSTHQEVSK